MKSIFDIVNKQKPGIIKLAKALINIPTVNPPGLNYERLVNFLEKRCNKTGLQTKRYVVPKSELKKLGISGGSKRINLIARWDTGAKKTLHINSHYDVVPVTGNWKTNPFQAKLIKGKLYGRGSEDMKANIACVIYAIDTLKKLKIKPQINIELSFTPDEEIGGKSGLEYLLKKHLVKADYAIGEGFEDDYVAIGNKGILWLEIEVLGKSVHSSAPYRGENSFENMVAVATELDKLKKRLAQRKTRYGTKDKRDKFPTLVMGGQLKGGHKVNIVPDSSAFSIDRRILPEEDLEKVKKEIEQLVKNVRIKNRKVRVRVRVLAEEKPVVTKLDKQLISAFSKAVKAVVKKRLKFAVMPGGTDLRFFIHRGIPTLGYSVKGAQRAHADDEFVFVKHMLHATKILALFLTDLR